MKITIKKSIDLDVEITLPCYMKDSIGFYKIVSIDKCVFVNMGSLNNGISIESTVKYILEKGEESTQEEFDKAFDSMLLKIHETNELTNGR